ncbi:MAG: MBL fold metallo-hydrolase [Acidobacteriota bacterium]
MKQTGTQASKKPLRTGVLVLFAVLAAVSAIGFALRDAIAERVLLGVVERNIGTDVRAELPDGLHVFLCGTGSPMPDITRAGPCTAVLAGDRAFVFDSGAGSVRKLALMRFPVGSTEALYLTHLHSDHIDGLGETMLQIWIGGSLRRNTPIYGPIGTSRVAEGFNDAYQIDAGYRLAHHGPEIADLGGFGLDPRELVLEGDSEVVFERGEVRITAFRVHHDPVEPAFGYRIDYKDRSVVISGDTTYDENLVDVAAGCDLLVHEALNMELIEAMEELARERGATSIEKILFDIRDYHTSPVDAARAAEASKAKALVLTHIVPPLPTPLLNGRFTRGMDAEYTGAITVGVDGLLLSLPAGSEEIVKEQLLR